MAAGCEPGGQFAAVSSEDFHAMLQERTSSHLMEVNRLHMSRGLSAAGHILVFKASKESYYGRCSTPNSNAKWHRIIIGDTAFSQEIGAEEERKDFSSTPRLSFQHATVHVKQWESCYNTT